jgi:purine/pyrimidine-nucleoside phosphorylase
MEHNVYYDGKIQSLGFQSDNGEATVGVVEPGTYIVPTDCVEHITILSGRARVKVSDQEWKEVQTGDAITLPANAEVVWETAAPNVCYFCVFAQ